MIVTHYLASSSRRSSTSVGLDDSTGTGGVAVPAPNDIASSNCDGLEGEDIDIVALDDDFGTVD